MNRSTPSFFARVAIFSTLALISFVLLANFRATAESGNSDVGKSPASTPRANARIYRLATAAPLLLPIDVDTTVDNAALALCTPLPNDCSLRGAVIFANTVPGTTINVPAGTYLLTLAGAENLSASGDLDIRGNNTSIVGAGAASTVIQQTLAERVFDINPANAGGFATSISGVTIANGTAASGAGILAGGLTSSLTISDAIFSNNRATASLNGNGGAISYTSNGLGNLTISDSTFTGNSAAFGVGGAVRYSATGTLSVERTLFVNNEATRNSGGAINATGPGAGGTYSVRRSSFNNNRALGAASRGGAIAVGAGTTTVNYSRLVDNTAGSGLGDEMSKSVGSVGVSNIADNWWGQNSGVVGGDLANLSVTSTWLQLRHAANPNTVCAEGSVTLNADIFGQNTGGSTAPANLVGLPPFTATFNNAVLGTISAASTHFVDGMASATYTAGTTNGAGSADVTADHQTVTASIAITGDITTSDPADQSVCEGATASFSTTSSGAGPFTYVWKQGATTLSTGDLNGRVTISSAGNSSTLTITGVLTGDANTYTVEAAGGCSTAIQTASLTVQAATTTTQPVDQTVCQGTTANFSTSASGTGPFSYAWTVDGSPAGGNSPNLSVPTGSLSIGNHTISVTTTGACGSDTETATLTVQSPATTTDPANQTVCQGATASFSTTAGGTGPFSYAWTVDGNPAGSDSATLNVDTTSLSVGNHTVVVTTTGACSSASQSATLTVQASTATTDPGDQTVCKGATANFSTTASGTGPFSYSWTVDGNPAGGDSPNLSVPTGSLSVGDHSVVVTVTGTCGSATQNATLTVQENTATSDPADQTVCQGAMAAFSTTATGTGPFTYAWIVDGSSFGGNTASINVDTSAMTLGSHTVAVTVTGACGSATQSASLTVQENTSTTDPADQTVCQGATANFSTTASGAGPFSYAWTVDGSPAGTNSPNLSVPTGSLSIGNHTVVVTVTGTCGTASQSATLTVQENTATSDPPDQAVCQGATASFTTTATGTGPFSYVWKKGFVVLNNGDLGGRVTITNTATTSTLSISNAQPGDAGSYTVETTGTCGTASQSANLTVDSAPPTLVLNADGSMWPPNHAYNTFNISTIVASAVDSCDGNVINNVVITSVSSDESENGNGDGNTFNDIVIAADCKSVQLRAERQGGGDGRVYRINLSVSDSQGNTTTATYKVFVPKSQNGAAAIDNGPAAGYTVNSTCP